MSTHDVANLSNQELIEVAVDLQLADWAVPGTREHRNAIRSELKKRRLGNTVSQRIAIEKSKRTTSSQNSTTWDSIPDDGSVTARLQFVAPKPRKAIRLPTGPNTVTNGYFLLEEAERAQRHHTMTLHQDETALWCRGLTLLVAGIDGTFENHQLGDPARGEALMVQCDLIGLSLTTAKTALDLLLVGYYSPAYAAIRHMLETFLTCGGIDAEPTWAFRWRSSSEGEAIEAPGAKDLYQKALSTFPELKGWWDNAYGLLEEMHSGAHPSGKGLFQLLGNELDQRILGPVYIEDRAFLGFGTGLFAVCSLLAFLGQIKYFPQEWHDRNAELRTDFEHWARDNARRTGFDFAPSSSD